MAQPFGFGIPSSSTSSNNRNISGSALTASSLFGGQPAQSSNVFGTFSGQTNQSSGTFGSFGGQSNQPSGFGSVSQFGTATSFSPSTQTFGGTSSNVFGSVVPVFGEQKNVPQTQSFGSSAQSGNKSVVSGTSTSNSGPGGLTTNPFSQAYRQTATFGSTSSPFGTTQSPTLFCANTESSPSLFGNKNRPPSNVRFTPSSATNQAHHSSIVDTKTGTSAAFCQGSNVFGTFTATNSKASTSSSSVFGTQNQPAGGVRKRNAHGEVAVSTLFGKPDSGASSQFVPSSFSQPSTTPLFSSKPSTSFSPSSLFKGPHSDTGHNEFSKPVGAGSAASEEVKPLFGKKQPDAANFGSTDTRRSLFGKQQPNTSLGTDARANLSGTSSAKAPLFPVTGISAGTSSSSVRELPVYDSTFESTGDRKEPRSQGRSNILFGKPAEASVGASQSQRLVGHPSQPSVALFKKAISSSSTHSAKDQDPKGVGLFGKPSSSPGKGTGLSRTTSSFNLMQYGGREDHRDVPPEKGELFTGEQQMAREEPHDRRRQENRDEESTFESFSRRSLSKWNRGREISQHERKRKEPSSEPELEPGKRIAVSTLSPRQRISSVRQSVGDSQSKTSILVKEIPTHLNKGPLLRRHFSRFGNITRLQPLPNKRAANITFKTHEEAALAKNEGHNLNKGGPPVLIFWRSTSVNKSPETKPGRGKEGIKRIPKGPSVANPIDDELASMAGTSDYQEEFGAVDVFSTKTVSRDVDVARGSAARRSPTPPRSAARRRSPTPPPTVSSTISHQMVSSSTAPDMDTAKGYLKSILGARTRDTTERIAILDSRDKLLRLLRGRQQSDLASATAFIGTCPDMCPEKERYYREDIRRLALYEVIPSTMTSITGLKSKVDHSRAVKEYSRSSADQEEPLPHELRPLPVLVMTMNYLLMGVADQGGEGQWAEWYDFLWNRTRGIRKDITQQQLCDIQVAELLEKCSRFHIFCSERLCEEDMMSFDAKINNENLTKCLQTLKELYADLEMRGVFCPNEAEFRAYMVLMNLNEGDILREIQQLRPEIRDSPHIAFAVKAYHALNANNYVRFFRLIEEEATFLNACALHRYFNQIRSKVLLIIMKAHGALGKTRVAYPIQEMIRLLCFEDAQKVIEFCDHYCLTTEGIDIILDSRAYLEPEGSLPQSRSQSLVEVKQNVSVGEIINGASLPPLHLPQPSSSFDDDGTFIISSDLQETLASSRLLGSKASAEMSTRLSHEPSHVRIEHSTQPTVMAGQEPPAMRVKQGLPSATDIQREKMVFSNEAIKSIARALILEVIDTNIMDIAQEAVKEEMARDAVIMSAVTDLASEVVEGVSRQIATEVHAEEEEVLRNKLAEEMAAQRQRVFTSLCDGIIEDTVADMSKKMANEEMSLVKAELHRQSQERSCKALASELLAETVIIMVQNVADEVYEVDVVAKRERLEATGKCVEIVRCRRFFQAWRLNYLANIRVKRAMLDFPSAPSGKCVEHQIHALVPTRPDTRITQNSFYIGERAKLSIESPMDVIQQQLHLSTRLSMASARRMLASLMMWRPLDMTPVVGLHLQRAFQRWKKDEVIEPEISSLQWKLAISLPQMVTGTCKEEVSFSKWIKAKLCKDSDRENILKAKPTYEGQVLSLYRVKMPSSVKAGLSLGLCIRCFQGRWTENQELSILKKDILKGTSAVMFVTKTAENLLTQQNTWKDECQRLHQIFKQRAKSPAVPLAIIVPRVSPDSSVSAELLDKVLGLTSLYDSELLTSVHMAQPFVGAQEQPLEYLEDWTTQLSNCLRFAASSVPVPPKLRSKTLPDFVEDAVIEFYKAPVYQDLRTRTRHQLLHHSPNTLLSLYNEVIEHVAMVSASSSLTSVSWPVSEFDQNLHPGEVPSSWNTELYLCDLYELITKMRLPRFRYKDMEADDWSSLCQDIWAYISGLTKKDSGSAKIYLFQQVTELLSRSKKNFDQFCWLASEDGPCEPSYVNMAWTDLIDACIHYRLMSVRTGHISMRKPDEEEESENKNDELEEVMVHYVEQELDDWEPPTSWVDAMRDTETAEDGQLKPTIKKAAAKRDETLMGVSSTEDENSTTAVEQALHEQNSEVTERSTSSDWTSLKLHLEQEREASQKYEKALKLALSSPLLEESSSSAAFCTASPISSPQRHTSYVSPYVRGSGSFLANRRPNQRVFDHEGTDVITTPQRSRHLTTHSPSPLSFHVKVPQMNDANEMSLEQVDERDRLSSSTLSERVSNLQQIVSEQHEADKLFEMRLKSLIDPTLL